MIGFSDRLSEEFFKVFKAPKIRNLFSDIIMTVLYTIAFIALAAYTVPVEGEQKHGENGWYVPQMDGTWTWMNKIEAEDKLAKTKIAEKASIDTQPVSFHLYTKTNPNQAITATKQSIDNSNFDVQNPTRFIIHGWLDSYKSELQSSIRDAWLSRGDYNIIAVDWERARSNDLFSCAAAMPGVGKQVASMIDFLVKNYNMSLSNLFVIGHSMGAHAAGFTGKNVQSGQIHTIVGLDPALPLFSYDKPDKRLSNKDALYVESIHTNADRFGFEKPIGHAAFYPNGGKNQPGCDLDMIDLCSHLRALAYYAEAVAKNSFSAMKCSDFVAAVANSCGDTYSCVRMGALDNTLNAAGYYYVPINSEAPFGIEVGVCTTTR